MKEFLEYLESVEQQLSQQELGYFRNVTAPLFKKLDSIVDSRMDAIQNDVQKELRHIPVQARLVTGYVSVSEKNNLKYMYPIFSEMNKFVASVTDESTRISFRDTKKLGKIAERQEIPLFSVYCDKKRSEYLNQNRKTCRGRLVFTDGSEKKVAMIMSCNDEYKNLEKSFGDLIRANRPEESYFPLPLCRRMIDVCLQVADLEEGKDIKTLQLEENVGEVLIPVWNVKRQKKPIGNHGMVESIPVKIRPYGTSGVLNQKYAEFSMRDVSNAQDMILDPSEDTGFLGSVWDKEKERLLGYFSDSTFLRRDHYGLAFLDCGQDKVFLKENVRSYWDLIGATEMSARCDEVSEAAIYYFVNHFQSISGLKAYNISIDAARHIKISFHSISTLFQTMAEEYAEFLCRQLKKIFLGYSFEREVIYRD